MTNRDHSNGLSRHRDQQRWLRGSTASKQAPRLRAFGTLPRILLLCCLGGLIIGKASPSAVEPLREMILAIVKPALEATTGLLQATGARAKPEQRNINTAAEAPSQPTASQQPASQRPASHQLDVIALKAELASLERENRALRALVPLAGTKLYPITAANVIAGASNPLAATVLISAGHGDGIRNGFPVVSGDRLVGRIYQTHAATAVVTRLSDRSSRVPVSVGRSETRAILVGTGNAAATLELIGEGARPKAGDVVVTSGIGGVFPRGLIIGAVAGEGTALAVVPDTEADYPEAIGVLMIEGAVFDPGDDANGTPPNKKTRQRQAASPARGQRP